MKNIPEDRIMLITVIVSEIPRRTLQEFKDSITELTSEEKQYLKQMLSARILRGRSDFLEAYNSI